MENRKIYIGNIQYELTTDDLRNSFIEFGDITDVAVVRDKETGASRGFGFVTFSTVQAAKDAIELGNSRQGITLSGRRLRVKEARPDHSHAGQSAIA